MTFNKGNGEDGKHYWLTPPDIMKSLDDEFHFDFDPAPYPKPPGFDGLSTPWGKSNYVNPPFGSVKQNGKKIGPTAWARKSINENLQGKRVVLVYPIDKWILMLLEAGAKVRNLRDVKWCSIEDGQPGKGTGRWIACFILEPKGPRPLDRLSENTEKREDNVEVLQTTAHIKTHQHDRKRGENGQ